MARRQFFDALHQSVWTGNIVEREIVMQAGEIECAGNLRMAKQGLQFRAEVYVGAPPVKVKWLDPQPVPRQHQGAARFRPEPHPAHDPRTWKAVDVPLEAR